MEVLNNTELSNIEKWVLKKRSIWFHIIVGYFSGFLWTILYFYCKYRSNTIEEQKNLEKNSNIKMTISFNDNYKRNEKSLYKKNKTRKMVSDYIVFDLETTGLDCNYNNIIEIGALKYINNQLIDEFNVLINPCEKLDSKIIEITGITDEMLKKCDTIDKVLPKFIEWIENYTLIAHNGSFDLGFIESNIKKLNLTMIDNKIIDTLYLAREFISDTPNHKLETLKQHFNLEYGSHRAIEDCNVTNYIYQYCKEKKEKIQKK